jgi:glycosyltransferase involved in cell wall biosynthesis
VKKPMDLLRSWADTNNNRVLIVAGSGPFEREMTNFVSENNLQERIKLIGHCTESDLAKYMKGAKAFVLPTAYETFSVVCAEARSCGCPVITDYVGALRELINDSNGLFRKENESWLDAVVRFEQTFNRDRATIAKDAAAQFSSSAVRKLYLDIISKL